MPWHVARSIGNRGTPRPPLVKPKPNPYYNPHEPTYRKFLFRAGVLLLVAAFAGYLAVPLITSTQDEKSLYSYLPIVVGVLASLFVVAGIACIVASKLNACWPRPGTREGALTHSHLSANASQAMYLSKDNLGGGGFGKEDDAFVDCISGSAQPPAKLGNIPALTIRRPTEAAIAIDIVAGETSPINDQPDIDVSPSDRAPVGIAQPPSAQPIPVYQKHDLPYPSAKIDYGRKVGSKKKVRPKSRSPSVISDYGVHRSHSSAADCRPPLLNRNFTGSGSPRSRTRQLQSTDIGRAASSAGDYSNLRRAKNYRRKPSTSESDNNDDSEKSNRNNQNDFRQKFTPILSEPNRRRMVRSCSPTKKGSVGSAPIVVPLQHPRIKNNSECQDEAADEVFMENYVWHNPAPRLPDQSLDFQEQNRRHSARPDLEHS